MKYDYDLIVIGAGSAGYNGAALGVRRGLRVALVDGAEELGGLCILRGCMPSKALLASARRLQLVREAGGLGVRVGDAGVEMGVVLGRKDGLIGEFAGYRRGQIEGGGFEFVAGEAVFEGAHEVRVALRDGGVRVMSAGAFLVATGSVVGPPPVPGLAEAGYLTSDDVLHLKEVPQSVVVLGAGAVGLEFAYYFNALGCKVTVLQRGRQLLRGSDADVTGALRESLERQGMTVHTGVTLVGAEKCAGGRRILYTEGGVEGVVEAECVLHAMGRRPNLGRLQLERAGVELVEGRLAVGGTQQSAVPHIFAAGDVCGPYEIVHLAIQQAEVAVRNVVRLRDEGGVGLEEMDYRLKLFVLFTHPELAQVGMTEAEARAAGLAVRVATYPFNDHGKSLVLGETEGFVKLMTREDTTEIIGAAVLGPEASSLIHEVAAVMHFHGKAADLAMLPHYHPTLAEIWTYPAEELM